MEEQGYLTAAEAARPRANPADAVRRRRSQDTGGFFADWVMDTGPEFFTRDTTEDVMIRTTLDQRIQTAAEDALIHVFDTQVRDGSDAQAAIVVMCADGAVRAMVGGRNIDATGAFNRATQALRQTGSSFKPFVYAAALDMGMSPLDIVEDAPITIEHPRLGPLDARTITTTASRAGSRWPRRCRKAGTSLRSGWRSRSGSRTCARWPRCSASRTI